MINFVIRKSTCIATTRYLSSSATKIWKSRPLSKIGQYIKSIGEDYKLMVKDTVEDMKERPLKSAIILSVLGVIGYFIKTNPSEESFQEQLLLNRNDLLLLGEPIRNPTSNDHMEKLTDYYNAGQMRRLNLLVCSLMWFNNFDKEVNLYEAQCKHMKVGWGDMRDRVVDIGVLGRWLWLEKAMTDYDINPTEWGEVLPKPRI